jgi:ribosomal protein L29
MFAEAKQSRKMDLAELGAQLYERKQALMAGDA